MDYIKNEFLILIRLIRSHSGLAPDDRDRIITKLEFIEKEIDIYSAPPKAEAHKKKAGNEKKTG